MFYTGITNEIKNVVGILEIMYGVDEVRIDDSFL